MSRISAEIDTHNNIVRVVLPTGLVGDITTEALGCALLRTSGKRAVRIRVEPLVDSIVVMLGEGTTVIIETMPHTRSLSVGGVSVEVMIPSLSFKLTFDGMGRLKQSHVGILLPHGIYPWPWGNVYEDGRICWGRVPTGDLTVESSALVLERFSSSGFNRDLRRCGVFPVTSGPLIDVASFPAVFPREW